MRLLSSWNPGRNPGRILRAAAVLALLSGCGAEFEPFEAAPRPIPSHGAEQEDRVGICYNALFSTPDKVRETASQACGPGLTPVPEKQDLRLACPLLLPIRATFACRRD